MALSPLLKRTIFYIPLTLTTRGSAISSLFGTMTGKLPKVRQVGDPVLREKAKAVDYGYIFSPEFEELVDNMVKVMREKKGVGIAAPQIGVSKRIIAVEFTGQHLKMAHARYGEKGLKNMQMSLFPLQIFVNPELKITDPTTMAFREGCLSVQGYSGIVPRAREVEVSALDRKGERVKFKVTGWVARIFQHELDHLSGNLYIDSMLYKTFTDNNWQDYAK